MLSAIDHGTNYQMCCLIAGDRADAGAVWRQFEDTWIRFFSAPEVVITDGGAEFQSTFAEGLERWSIL